MKGIIIDSHDPYYNLALEETLFDSLENEEYFLLWQNSPSVIVGRHQNTVEEVNEAYVRTNNLPVVRRTTGGGAVYHDLGNLNFSFLSTQNKNEENSFAKYTLPIANALNHLGFNVEISGRNDLTIAGKKFSGNAKRKSGNKILQHGTLMVHLDISNLSQILTGNPDKYTSKAVSSHKNRVGNLIEFMPHSSPKELMQKIKEVLIKYCSEQEISMPQEIKTRALNLTQTKYRTWEWNFGKSPTFSVKLRKRFTWGAFEFLAEIQDGYIQYCKIFGDFFVNSEIKIFEDNICGLPYQKNEIIAYFHKENAENIFLGANKADFETFFNENLI